MRKFLIFLILNLVFISSVFAKEVTIRVAIKQDSDQLRATVKGPYRIVDLKTNEIIYNSPQEFLKYVLVTPQVYGFKFASKPYLKPALKIIPLSTKEVFINGCPYKGSITLIRKDNGRILVINNIDMDDYLKGVLFHEISHLWPLEVLKAQTVASRTFAYYQMQNRKNFDYDVTNDIYSQVYGGSYAERVKCNLAVDSTSGEVLNYQNKTFLAYFHATCAGHTEDAAVLWKTDLEPLKGVECNYCKISPHYNWKTEIKLEDLKNKLINAKYAVGNILKIEPLTFTESKRIKDLRISCEENSEVVISAKDFRQIFNPNLIRSTNFSVSIKDAKAIFKGIGWGHGVGLCQWGAFYLAAKGCNYKKILEYYYPGSIIAKIQ